MKANVLYNINDLRYTDVETPKLKQSEVLVKIKAAGICGSDVDRVFKNGTYHFPTIIGHEFSGEVFDVFSHEDKDLIGKRVAVFPLIPCKKCESCKNHNYQLCDSYNYLGSRCDGGFAEFVAVPKWNLMFLPDNVSCEEGAMLEPAAVALHTIRRFHYKKIESLTIIGPGTIGIIIAQLAKIVGIKKIILVGRSNEKLNFAKKFNSELITINSKNQAVAEVVCNHTDGNGADIVIEGTGASNSLTQALNIVKKTGTVITLGNPLENITLSKQNYWKILRKEINLKGVWNSTYGTENSDWNIIVNLLKSNELHLKNLITHKLPMSDLLYGLNLMKNSEIYTNKIMLINH
ncbi:MAG: galactitol-1-phosphate 5-dehydrogenase [Prevotellaceae bacterium]|jgi:L-iditol 2-dehydrogenase|nr:galactitol-1-phosphate 5-dehydrogenase [Prevotellaceae bacterium]